MSNKAATHFLNVDLDVRAKSSLKELVDAFVPAVFELGSEEEGRVSFELNSVETLSVDETITAFYNAVEALPPSARAIFENAESRTFDIGIQGGKHPHQTQYCLSKNTIARLSSMNADLGITVYAPPKE